MPVDDNVGHSIGNTPEKERMLGRILAIHMRICQSIFRRHYWCHKTYQYFDLNAGKGFNEQEDCDGSPVVFLKTAERIGLSYHAAFIEIEPANTLALYSCLNGLNHHDIHTGDNAIILPGLLHGMPKNCYGLIYTDPNGRPNFDLLAAASQAPRARYLDILIRYSASSVKRTEHITGQKMNDLLSTIKKDVWLLREVQKRDKWQWTFLLGTNWPNYPEIKKEGFYRLDSDEGQRTFEKLNYTSDEIKERQQPSLYNTYEEYLQTPEFKTVRQQVMDRARGICEMCHKARATEPHHLRYPKWGTFDVSENMIAVCHRCHCQIHGKDN